MFDHKHTPRRPESAVVLQLLPCPPTYAERPAMPALLTHDFFGKDVLDSLSGCVGGSRDEAEAFLLGNQGPDPLFYAVLNPRLSAFSRVGSLMHRERPSELIHAFKQALSLLPEAEIGIGRAYALGFLCHYTLDARMHPLVYHFEYALCDAGVKGLSRDDAHEVHGVIESEYDEMVLFTKRGETVATYLPHRNVLHASDKVLHVVSRLYAYVIMTAYGQVVPENLFSSSVRSFRLAQHAFDSPTGIKRALIGRLEELVRPYSFFRCMSHRPLETLTCEFDNREHAPWTNPFTDEVRTDAFWDIYDRACAEAKERADMFLSPHFDLAAARRLTGELNFSGEPTVATIVSVRDSAKGPVSSHA